jgi:hypothetical protein
MSDMLSQEEIDALLEVVDDDLCYETDITGYRMSEKDIYKLVSDTWCRINDNIMYFGAFRVTKINEEGYIISIALPGVSKENISITNVGSNAINIQINTTSPFNIQYEKFIELNNNKVIKVKSVDGILYIYCKAIKNDKINII